VITKFFKVTTTKYYALDYYNKKNLKENVSMINGWSSNQVKKNWFEDFSLEHYHVTRDSSEVGNTTEISNIELVDKINLMGEK